MCGPVEQFRTPSYIVNSIQVIFITHKIFEIHIYHSEQAHIHSNVLSFKNYPNQKFNIYPPQPPFNPLHTDVRSKIATASKKM